ncbi:T9SS type A sorting domain-containing protein [Filimonas effusa]|nr:T9SS type A sorting domain-containing protein [Filimonas effusa]
MAVQRYVRAILSLFAMMLAEKDVFCQDVYIPPGASVHLFVKDTVSIFGNMEVAGYAGQDSAQFLYFSGNSWKNAATASFSDKGIIGFKRLGNGGGQALYGAYSASAQAGTRMPVLWLNNTGGLTLDNGSDLSIRELHFVQGILSLNGASLVVRNGQAASPVSGYHPLAFVATGGDVMGGFLEIQNLTANGKNYVWPIGTQAGSYTPFSFINNGTAATVKTRVFNNVYEQGLSGASINNRSTGTTWMVNSSANLTGRFTLQHLTANEGPIYATNHNGTFVGRFQDVSATWDKAGMLNAPVSPGSLTTGSPVAEAATTYTDLTSVPAGTTLFAGLVAGEEVTCTQQVMKIEGTRLSPLNVKLDWVMQNLNNLSRMVIEKDVYNTNNWITVDSITPVGGITAYTFTDTAAYSNTSAGYRLRLLCTLGGYVYSNSAIVAPPAYARDPVLMYPNPAIININVAIPDYVNYVTLAVYDLTGHMLIKKLITGPVTKLDVSALPAGSYNIFLVTKDNKTTGNLRFIKVN